MGRWGSGTACRAWWDAVGLPIRHGTPCRYAASTWRYPNGPMYRGPPARPELRGQSPLPQTLQARGMAHPRRPVACPIGSRRNPAREGAGG